ncbi:hypothetical protein [Streptomyces sp. NPDC002855]|uniref:hypothetical protein n=1 Tax=Streptomyces sp. NPDC002855 TaxID=3154437 RepID=UPI00332E3798
MDQEMCLALTLDEAHDVMDVVAHAATAGDQWAEDARLLCELVARVPSRGE